LRDPDTPGSPPTKNWAISRKKKLSGDLALLPQQYTRLRGKDLSRLTAIFSRRGADRTGGGDSATERCFPTLAQYPEGVIYDVSPRDHMYNSYDEDDRDGYFSLGRAALDCIRVALLTAQVESPKSILDLPSGHGRVLRYLKAEYPEARLAACDIDHEAVDYCAATFGATPVYGQEHPAEIQVEDQFDLIWCGSLLTHLDQQYWPEFIDFFMSRLVVGGVLIFTTSGRKIAAKLADEEDGATFMREEEARAEILEGYKTTGFGYANYSLPDGLRDELSLPVTYGISVAKPTWVLRQIQRRTDLQLVSFTENRWGSQDVLTCLRVDKVATAYPYRVPLRLHKSPSTNSGG
jgi:SAM-dependent methyltransferase